MRDAGLLSGCLVESDVSAVSRARRQRRKALLASMVLELIILAALLLAPFASPSPLPSRLKFVPTVPYRNLPPAAGRTLVSPHNYGVFPPTNTPRLQWFARNAHPVQASSTAGPSDAEAPSFGPGVPGGTEASPGVPGGTGDTSPNIAPLVQPVRPPQERPIWKDQLVQEALLVNRVVPVYPELARQMRIEGTVRLQAVIGRDGAVQSLEILSGQPMLARAAIAAVREWRYRPTLLRGEPVEVETFITVIFTLTR
jgi:periplasmic protein TonB